MSAVKCDLKCPWPSLSQLGQRDPNAGLTDGGGAEKWITHLVTTGTVIMKKE